ncbi:MAG: hypothetical protein KBB01_06855 [Candidatus Omnitrophica bacterium]|nr:hypothetical protein [Candidatus Omnitrophota bacterium]
MNDSKVEISNNNNDYNREGLRILARIIARKFLAENNMKLVKKNLEGEEDVGKNNL